MASYIMDPEGNLRDYYLLVNAPADIRRYFRYGREYQLLDTQGRSAGEDWRQVDFATGSLVPFPERINNLHYSAELNNTTNPAMPSNNTPATYNVNGVDISALPNGDRDFHAELQAQSPHNAMTYRPSGFTMQDLDEMAARIQARARPAERGMSTYYNAIVSSGESENAYNTQEIVQRYGHLLTAADQQRLGYVAPPPTQVDGQQVHTLSYPGVRLGDAPPTQHERMNAIMAHTFGERIAPAKIKGPEPVANFLTPPSGPTAQELAAADEWLKNSPWG